MSALAEAPVTVPGPRERRRWMDVLRGAAIVLVVLWHAVAVPALFGARVPEVVLGANFFFLPFRMPTLMLLSGLLLASSLRKPVVRYYVGKVQFVVWPYLVWVGLDRLVMGAEHPWFHWRSYYATSYLWFLFFIAVFYAAAPLLRRVPTAVVVLACAAANVALPPGIEDRMAYFAVFFFLGHLVGQHPQWLDRATSSRWTWLMAAGGVAVGALSVATQREVAYQVVLAPFSVAGIVAVAALARWWDARGGPVAGLAAVGRHSIVFYLSHFPVMVAVVHAARAVGQDDPLVIAAVDVVAALAVGTVLVHLRDHRPVRWLFEGPRTPAAALQRRLMRVVGWRPARRGGAPHRPPDRRRAPAGRAPR